MLSTSAFKLPSFAHNYSPSSWDIWALGITVVIGGQYVGWNFALSAGFGSYIIAYFLMGSAYICLVLVLAELASVLPFGGGSYALIRSQIGFYAGFIIGCIEAMGYIIYTATSALFLAKVLGEIFNTPASMVPVFCLMFYLSAIAIYLQPRYVFWIVNMVLGLTSLIVLLLFCLGNFQYVNFFQYAPWSYDADKPVPNHNNHPRKPSEQWFHDGGFEFIRIFYLCAWHFVGVESLNFTSQIVTNSTIIVPRGYMLSVITLFVTGTLVSFTVICTSPGIEAASSETFPLAFGLSRAYGLSYKAALAVMAPAIYATSFGFILGYAKIFQYMGASKLLPFSLSKTTSCGSPYVAILLGAFIGQIICIAEYFNSSLLNYSFNACILAAFVTYIAQCICYLQLKEKSKFKNPLGTYGAIYTVIVFSVGIISVIGFQEDKGAVVGTLLGVVGVLSLYYYLYANTVQIFNEEEVKYTFNILVRRRNKFVLHRIKHQKIYPKVDSNNYLSNKFSVFTTRLIARKSSITSGTKSGDPGDQLSTIPDKYLMTILRNTERFRKDYLSIPENIRVRLRSSLESSKGSNRSSQRTRTRGINVLNAISSKANQESGTSNKDTSPLNSTTILDWFSKKFSLHSYNSVSPGTTIRQHVTTQRRGSNAKTIFVKVSPRGAGQIQRQQSGGFNPLKKKSFNNMPDIIEGPAHSSSNSGSNLNHPFNDHQAVDQQKIEALAQLIHDLTIRKDSDKCSGKSKLSSSGPIVSRIGSEKLNNIGEACSQELVLQSFTPRALNSKI